MDLLTVIALLVGPPALAVVAGLLIPRTVVACLTLQMEQPPEVVLRALSDCAADPASRTALEALRLGPGRPDGHSTSPPTDCAAPNVLTPRVLLTLTANGEGPRSQHWRIEVEPAASGSRVRITERSDVPNPLDRLLARCLLRHSVTLSQYLHALESRLGQPARLA